MNASRISSRRQQFIWSAVGLMLGAVAAMNPLQLRHITVYAGIAIWFLGVMLALGLSSTAVGARSATVLAGLFAAVPVFVDASPLSRLLLACFMGLNLIAAATFTLVPPIADVRARLAHLCSWCGTRRIERRAPALDTAALRQLVAATIVLAAAIAVAMGTDASGAWLLVRWLAAGVATLALAEMMTASFPFAASLVGVTMPQLFQSPYLSTSIGEFWTQRWNISAAELFRRFIFAPLARHSIGLALFATFAVSGIAHTLLAFLALGRWRIALVCGAFFVVQPLLISAERALNIRRLPQASRRVWTLMALAVTSPLILEPSLRVVEQSWGPPDNVPAATVAALSFCLVISVVISIAALVSLTSGREVCAVIE
jgi:hypothetical protein